MNSSNAEINTSKKLLPKRLYLLDALRGLAALSVVVWHFQHFYYLPGGGLPENFVRNSQPFFSALRFFYESGPAAVKLFFCLSGFIFFWLYLGKIRDRKESPKNFIRKRFSRLYPLHFLTLIVVALIQLIAVVYTESHIVYRFNDLKHFILNLTLTSHWGFQDGWSFNAPVWSVSMEVFAYIFFFVFAFIGLGRVSHVFGVVILSGLLISYHPFAIVLFCFFSGGLAYLAYQHTLGKIGLLSRYGRVLTLAGASLLIVILYSLASVSSRTTSNLLTWSLIFPGVIYLLAILQSFLPALGKSLKFLGDSSYAIYLTHFPIQALIILGARLSGINLVLDGLFFVPYIIFTVMFSYYVYHWFEKPSMDFLRTWDPRFLRTIRFRLGQAGKTSN